MARPPIFRTASTQARKQAPGQSLSEVFPASAADAGALGFVLSRLERGAKPVLWVQDRLSLKETGRPYLPGLAAGPPILHVAVARPVDVLWALEEGLRCKALAGAIGEIWGEHPAVNLTATKRLAMRAEAVEVPCWLIRRASPPDLSAARNRWRVASLPSARHGDDPQAPGDPRWQVELFRSRQARPGTWVATHDRAADRVHLSAPSADGALAEGDGASRQRAL